MARLAGRWTVYQFANGLFVLENRSLFGPFTPQTVELFLQRRRNAMPRKPAAHKKMMKERPHKDPPKDTKAYKLHAKKEKKEAKRV